WRADFLRSVRVLDHVDNDSPLGPAIRCWSAGLLSNEVGAHSAVIVDPAGGIECSPLSALEAFRGFGENRRARARPPCCAYIPRQCIGSQAWLSPRQLGHSLVAVGGRDVLSLFPAGHVAARPGKAIDCSAAGLRGARSDWPDVHSRQ